MVTMSGAALNSAQRQELESKKIDSEVNITGRNASGGADGDGQQKAGITATFATNVNKAIDKYIEDIEGSIEKLSTVTANSNNLFRGEDLVNSINNFIEGCKEVAKSYTEKLRTAEQEIINSVQNVYETQDTDIGSQLRTERDTIESQGFGGQE